MQIVVVSLTRAVERRAAIERQFAALKLPFVFLDATDGRHLTRFERSFVDDRTRKTITEYPLTDGEIGCWHSHRRIMLDMAMHGPEIMAIIEDDAEITPDLPRVLAALERSRVDFDVVDLHRVGRRGQTFVKHSVLAPGFDIGWVRYTQMRTTGYVIRREGAIKFLQAVPRFSHAIDKAMKRWWSNGLNCFALSAAVLAAPRDGHSYIDDQGRAARATYPDAGQLYWRLARFATRMADTIQKRRHFDELMRRSTPLLAETQIEEQPVLAAAAR